MMMRLLAPMVLWIVWYAVCCPALAAAYDDKSTTRSSHPPEMTLTVGPGKAYATLAEAVAAAGDGFLIEIDAGTYRGDVAFIGQDNLTIRGMGGRAHLAADGSHSGGKGILAIEGNGIVIENIEFSGASVPDKNGAGIRAQGAGLTVRNCYFHDNENGILGGIGDITIEFCEFADNGYGDGQSHNLYIDGGMRLTFRYNYTHHARIGHNLKSRAQENHIMYNRIMDERSGTASYAIDLPDGGNAYIIGNLIQQGPHTDNSTMVAYGAEGMRNPGRSLCIVNNTFVNERGSGRFVSVNSQGNAKLINNIFAGNGTVLSGPGTPSNNLVTSADNAMFADLTGYDYRLTREAVDAIDKGIHPGSENGISLDPIFHYHHPTGKTGRVVVNQIDIGAYERNGDIGDPSRPSPPSGLSVEN